MSAPRDRALVVCLTLILFTFVTNRSSDAAQPTLEMVLSRAAAYVADYEERLSLLVAEERYEQQLTGRVADDSGGGALSARLKRTLVSDYVMVRAPGGQAWSGFRDTFVVDGQPIRTREDRLAQLLSDGQDDGLDEAARLDEENARYNLGNELVYRTINVPLLPLDFLSPQHQAQFKFRHRGQEDIAGRPAVKLDYRERGSTTFIKTPAGPDQVTRGTIWIDSTSGAVLKTYLNIVVTPTQQAKITVEYQIDETLGFLVPSVMRESYQRSSTTITGTATYAQFRQFRTTARIVEAPK